MLVADFYKILEFETSDDFIKARLLLNKEHEIYKGHFPGQPVVPGVMQLQMIKELVEKSTKQELLLSDVASAKYINMIDPNASKTLQVEIKISQLEPNRFKISASINDGELVFTKLKGVLSAK